MIPYPHLEKKPLITYDKRDTLMYFNTSRFWHCWFDVETKHLYNEYCRLVMDDATEYLLINGFIDENLNQLKMMQD